MKRQIEELNATKESLTSFTEHMATEEVCIRITQHVDHFGDLLTIVKKRQLKNYISISSIVVSIIIIVVNIIAAIFIIIITATQQQCNSRPSISQN